MIGEKVSLRTRDGEVTGILRGVDERGNLRVESPVRILAGTPVSMECDGGFWAFGEAMYCQALGNGFLVGLLVRADRRSEPRIEAAGSAILEDLSGGDRDVIAAEIRHVSMSGAGLLTDRPFQAGTVVRLETSSWFAFGEVRHSTPCDEAKYLIGIVFLTGCFIRRNQRGGSTSPPNRMVESTV